MGVPTCKSMSLDKPFTFRNFGGWGREEEEVSGGNHTAPAERIVCADRMVFNICTG